MATKPASAAVAKETAKQIDYLYRALKAPRIRDAAARRGDQARDGSWTHEEYLAAVLSREVSARPGSGAELLIRAAGFPRRKSLEDFNLDHQPAGHHDRSSVRMQGRSGGRTQVRAKSVWHP